MSNTLVRKQESTNTMRIDQRLERVERKLDALIRELDRKGSTKKVKIMELDLGLDIMTLLSLPDHLRKSVLTISKFGDFTAEDVALQTERSRSIESAYLNQLSRMGYLSRRRDGNRVYFSIGANQQLPKGVKSIEDAVAVKSYKGTGFDHKQS